MVDVLFNYLVAEDEGERRHALVVVEDLGITYRQATAHPIGDCWILKDCANLPDPLPKFMWVVGAT